MRELVLQRWGSNLRIYGSAFGAAPSYRSADLSCHILRRPNQRCCGRYPVTSENIADKCDARTHVLSEGQQTPTGRPVSHAVLATPRRVQPNAFPLCALRGHVWQRRGSNPRPCGPSLGAACSGHSVRPRRHRLVKSSSAARDDVHNEHMFDSYEARPTTLRTGAWS